MRGLRPREQGPRPVGADPGPGLALRSALRSRLPAPGAAPGSRLRDENDSENRGQRPQAYVCHRLLTRACRGPGQSESNFINTVIKREGNYSKYWKNVRVAHEFGGYRVFFGTQGIDDSEDICSGIMRAVPQPASAASLLGGPGLGGSSRFPRRRHTRRPHGTGALPTHRVGVAHRTAPRNRPFGSCPCRLGGQGSHAPASPGPLLHEA